MATQICPKCKRDSFTWSMEDDESLLTFWGCNCGYYAFEDESEERECKHCGKKTESYMRDDQNLYWWCSTCNSIEIVKPISHKD